MKSIYYFMGALIIATLFHSPQALAYSRYEWRKDIYGVVFCAEVTPAGDQIQRVSNDVCRQNVGSQYAWKKDIYGTVYCAEITRMGGDQIQRVESDLCRQGGRSSSYHWERGPRGAWVCVEYDSFGRFIGYAPGALCDHPPGNDGLGSSYQFNKDIYGVVYCAEITPAGDQIQRVDLSLCRRAVGVIFNWKKDIYGVVYCGEFTPDYNQIQRVETNVCRSEVGSYFDWKKDIYGVVYCGEMTPDGDQIQRVDSNYCR